MDNADQTGSWERDECTNCHGTGMTDDDKTCEPCKGEGTLWSWVDDMV